MAGEAQDVDPERVHVDGKDPGALGGVDDEDGPGLAGGRPDRGEILDRAEHVRAVVDDHHPGPGAERIAYRTRVHVALGIGPDPRDPHRAVALQVPQGTQHRVVLDPRGDDVVTLLDEPEQRDVQRIGDVLGEHHPVGVAAEAEELREQAAGLEDHLLRLDREGVSGPARVDPVTAKEGIHEPVHRLGLRPGRGGVVEVVVLFHGEVLARNGRSAGRIA